MNCAPHRIPDDARRGRRWSTAKLRKSIAPGLPCRPNPATPLTVSTRHVVSCAGLYVVALLIGVAHAGAPPQVESLLRGSAFVRELDKPLSIDRERAELRPLLDRLAEDRRIAIVLDRRVDPGMTIAARFPPATVRDTIDAIARQADAVVRIVGDTVVVGPESGIGRLRTVCILRGLEFDALADVPGRRRFALAATHSLAWDDLDRPADLVERIAQRAELTVAGLEQVPHDLWARGAIVEMTATEALSWVLGQYDLTFEWTGVADGIRIVPLSGVVAVTKEHPVRRIDADEALQRVRARFPDLEVRIDGKTLVATGLIEQQDAIARIAQGENPDAPRRAVQFESLAKRRITLRVVRKPASAVLAKLQESGVDIQIDDAALRAADVDLDQKISLEVKQATIEAVLEAICRPVGASYSVDGETVHIPARP